MSYNIGDFVKFDRSHLTDKEGLIVKKYIGFDGEYTYMISIKQFFGDYSCMKFSDIISSKEVPLEYKLSYILSFNDWWFKYHKNIFQYLLIQTINKKN